jgi:hypothetical protein
VPASVHALRAQSLPPLLPCLLPCLCTCALVPTHHTQPDGLQLEMLQNHGLLLSCAHTLPVFGLVLVLLLGRFAPSGNCLAAS